MAGEGYEITYNEFGSEGSTDFQWGHIRVQNYQSTPMFAEDDQTHWSTMHTITGTALLLVSTGLSTTIENARTKLQKVGRNLVIKLENETIVDVGNNDFDKTDGIASDSTSFDGQSDTAGYPRPSFEINKFYGSSNAMVSFTFTWIETKVDTVAGEDAQSNWGVLSHQWRQRFSISENGLQSWTVEGTLHVRAWNVPCAAGGEVQHGNNPDSYRRLVMPDIPTNFRIKSMDWATDPSGEKLIYSITMQEHARGLPAPARRGTGSYTFKKQLDAQGGLLGTKMFDAELEGDTNTDTRHLLAALLDASTSRIKWTGAGRDMITSIEIRENDIFSRKVIGIRITAKGMPDVSQDGGETVLLSGLNFGIFDDFVPDNAVAIAPDAYGSALLMSFKKLVFLPYANYTADEFPIAKFSQYEEDGCKAPYTEVVYEIPSGEGPIDVPTGDYAKDLSGDVVEGSPSDDAARYIRVVGTEKVAVKSGITVFSTYGENLNVQMPWQTEGPTVICESEYTISRLGQPPPMMFYKLNTNMIVLEQDSSVSSDELDSNGNRIYTRRTRRRTQILAGYSDDVIHDYPASRSYTIGSGVNYVFGFHYITFSTNVQRRPYDPRTDMEMNIENEYGISGIIEDAFELDFRIPVDT